MIKRGIIHVENTEGIIEFARFLVDEGWTIFSANKTEELLRRENVHVEKENALTVNNFYLSDTAALIRKIMTTKDDNPMDFEAKMREENSFSLICMNLIPSMKMEPKPQEISSILLPSNYYISTILRNCVVNYKNLLILTDPADYEEAIIQLRTDNITNEFREYLAAKALNMVSAYDGGISSSVLMSDSLKNGNFMNYLMVPFVKQESYETGSNSQQISCLYKYPSESGAVSSFNRHSGLNADFNVVSDAGWCWEVISFLYNKLRTQYSIDSTNSDGYDFITQCTPLTGTVFTIAVKYKSVIAAGLATNVTDSFKKTCTYDSENITGVTLGCSTVIDETAAQEIIKTNIVSIVAPGFTSEAKDILAQNPNIRLIPIVQTSTTPFDMQLVNGGLLFQTKDNQIFSHWDLKTKIRPSQNVIDELAFGMVIAMSSRTHCGVLIKDNSIVGISQCCKSSVKAIDDVLEDAKELQKRSGEENNPDYIIADALICDTEVPLCDSMKELIRLGVCAIIQTGTEKADDNIIKYCEECGVSLIFTGMTHISY